MGFFTDYRRRRHELTGAESTATLDHMKVYFDDGRNWTQAMYENASGARCLVGAAQHVRASYIDDAKHWLLAAIAEVKPGTARIEDFNDTSTFAEVAAVIERARQLATQSMARALPPPVPRAAGEVLPPPAAVPFVFTPLPRAGARRRSLAGWVMD